MNQMLKVGVMATAVVMTSAVAEARHVKVSYVDADRPAEYNQADVVAGIQRVMREWEAHNSWSGIVFQWGGVIPLSAAPNDFNNIVVRWLNTDYSSIRGYSCRDYVGCIASPPTPSNHIFMASYWDTPTIPRSRRWNNPRWTFGMGANEDMISVLVHEMGHLLKNTGDSANTASTVMRGAPDFTSRYLWNSDILGMDYNRYNMHYQALQYFAVNPSTGGASWISQVQPPYFVRSPASLAVGNGAGNTGHYLVAYGTTTPAGWITPPNALLVRMTDGVSNHVDRVVQGSINGGFVGTTYHRPCVAASATGSDHYLVWTSPNESGGGWRQILSAESHGGAAFTWSQPEVIPGAFTRSGVSCAIDRATEQLVVVFSGAGEEGIFLAQRPSLTAGAGQWGANVRRLLQNEGASSYGPPDVAFDFFSTGPGTLSWQDNPDLQVHTVSLFASGGTYFTGTPVIHTGVEVGRLRSWPVATVESNPILGLSMYTSTTLTSISAEERRSFPGQSPAFVSSESYSVGGGSNPARHYTGAASNRVLLERAFLSTANLGQ